MNATMTEDQKFMLETFLHITASRYPAALIERPCKPCIRVNIAPCVNAYADISGLLRLSVRFEGSARFNQVRADRLEGWLGTIRHQTGLDLQWEDSATGRRKSLVVYFDGNPTSQEAQNWIALHLPNLKATIAAFLE